jgi:hypothetical protein
MKSPFNKPFGSRSPFGSQSGGGGFDGDIILFAAGQSNMDNALVSEGVPAHYSSLNSRIKIWVDGSGWETYDPATNASQVFPGVAYGPEAECAYQLAQRYSTKTIYIVKYGQGATNLYQGWKPAESPSPDGVQFRIFRDTYVLPALADLSGDSVEIGARYFIWMQGEADASNATWAADYETGLPVFFDAAQGFFGGTADIIVGRICDDINGASYPHKATVRAAQLAVVNARSDCYLISTDSIPLVPASPHFTKAGYETLGLYFYQGIVETYAGDPSSISITWGGSYTDGDVPSNTGSGTTIATLSGNPGAAVDDVLTNLTFSEVSDPSGKISVTGTSLKTDGTITENSTYNFTVRATNTLGRSIDLASSITGVAAAGFTNPSYFGSDLIFWVTANDLATITKNGSNEVSLWADKGANGNDFTGNGTPVYDATALGGYPGMVLTSGSSDRFYCDITLTCSKWAIFTVLSKINGSTAFMTALTYMDSAAPSGSGVPPNYFLLSTDSGNMFTYWNGGVRSTKAITDNTPSTVFSIADGTNITNYVNNSAGTPYAYSGALSGSGNRLVIGEAPDLIRPWHTRPISEMFMVDLSSRSALTTDEINAIQAYFETEWGL